MKPVKKEMLKFSTNYRFGKSTQHSIKNGQAQIYIADDGCSSKVVASDFNPNN